MGEGEGEGGRKKPRAAIWGGGLDRRCQTVERAGDPAPRPHLLRAAPSVRRGGEQ